VCNRSSDAKASRVAVPRWFSPTVAVVGASFTWREPRADDPRPLADTVRIGRGRHATTAYMAYSDRVGPGVLVLHEFFGLQPSFERYADGLRDEGFTVLVPDLYAGAVAADVQEARALASSLEVDGTMRTLHAAAEHLTSNWHPRLGAVGFSLGADLASALAQEGAFDATVLYYGVGEIDPDKWRGPLCGHYAEKDEWIDRTEVGHTFAALQEAGVETELHDYPGTGHWFANESVAESFDPESARLAAERTVDFLRYHLA
jgi:carboxymethylenebutenolidase